MIHTSDSELYTNKDYNAVVRVLSRLERSGIFTISDGYCVSVAHMIETGLNQAKIPCKIVECSVTILDKKMDRVFNIGYDNIVNNNEIDTHVVVVTETSPPLIIDASLYHKIGQGIVVDSIPVLAALGKSNKIVDIFLKEYELTYIEKQQHVPFLLQESIIKRIETDRQIFKDIKTLKKLNYVGIGLSVFAVVAVINQVFRWFI